MFRARAITFIVTACMAVLVWNCTLMAQDDALRKEFEALYAKADEAFKSKDASFIKSFWTEDYALKGKDGKLKDRAQLGRETDELFASIKEVTSFVTKVESVKQGKDENEAIVETSGTGKVIFVSPDGRTHRIEVKSKDRGTWVRTDAGWKLRYAEELESTVTEEEAAWIKYTSHEGRYSVLLPGQPKLETTQSRSDKPKIYIAIIINLPGSYSTGYWDRAPNHVSSLDDWHDGQLEDLRGKGSVLSDNSISLSGYPGRELVTLKRDSSGEETITATRIYEVDERIYMAIFTYLKSDESNSLKANGTKFFDSFQITKKP